MPSWSAIRRTRTLSSSGQPTSTMGFINKFLAGLLVLTGITVHAQVRDSFVLVPAGRYWVGKANFIGTPLRRVHIDSFRIAIYETTNRQFAAFVTATNYVTDAEKRHDA